VLQQQADLPGALEPAAGMAESLRSGSPPMVRKSTEDASTRPTGEPAARHRVARQVGIVALLAVACGATGACFRTAFHTNSVYTHLAYLPSVLACWWWGRKGLLVAGALGLLVLLFHVLEPAAGGLWGDLARVGVFLLVAWVLGEISKKARISHVALREAREELELRVRQRTAELTRTNEALEAESAGHKATENALRQSDRDLSIRNQVAEVFLTVPDEKVYGEVLPILLKATASRHGVFGYIGEDGALIVPSMTKDVWSECRIPNKTIVFPREKWGNGLWCRAIREKRAVHSNAPARLPEGHIPISRNVSVPILHQDEVVGLLQVANKETDYDEQDIRFLEAIAGHIAPILRARLQRDREENARKQAVQGLRKLADDLARSNQELEEFAYVAPHDLQEPLRKIRAFGDRLLQRCADQLDEESHRFLERMVVASRRMQTLIDDLLTYSRLTTRSRPLTPVALGEVAQGVLDDLEPQIQEARARVEVGELPTLDADPTQMRQLLQNLISNALKFRQHDVDLVVKVRGRILEGDGPPPAAGRTEITVEDNGIGFEQKHAPRIFEMFQRLHGRMEYPGTGMGLAICRRIVDRHHGTIEARSAPGQGATFTVTLPLKHEEEGTTECLHTETRSPSSWRTTTPRTAC